MVDVLREYTERFSFTNSEKTYITNLIENKELDSDEIKEGFIEFLDRNFEVIPQNDNSFNIFMTDHYSNLLTYYENVMELVEYID